MATESLPDDESQLVDMTNGETVPSTAASRKCVERYFGVLLESGAACADPAIDLDDGFVESGRTNLATSRFADEELHLVPVAFGGPFDSSEVNSPVDPMLFAAAPGAVVVTAGMPLAEGGRLQVIGLR